MRKTLRNTIAGFAGAIGLASLLPMQRAEAQVQVSGNVEYIQSERADKSFVRENTLYKLPGSVSGFSFVELYQNGKGYFGKTILKRLITPLVGPKAEVIYGNDLVSRAGFGVNVSIPRLGKDNSANIGFLPVWLGDKTKRTQAQYGFNFNLPRGFNFNGFGEWNLAAKNGAQWSYGETEVVRKIGPAEIGYNIRMRNNENAISKAIPKLEHGLVFTLNFGPKKEAKK